MALFLTKVPYKVCNITTMQQDEEAKTVTENLVWTLYTNDAASKVGSGASLILTDPEENQITYTIQFDFKTKKQQS